MNTKIPVLRGVMMAVIATTAGFFGSVVHDWALRSRSKPGTSSDVLRATRFELLSETGQLLSYWGPDSNTRIPSTTPRGVLLVFLDPNGTRRCQIGSRPGDYGPELQFYDQDGPSENRRPQSSRPRLDMSLGYNDDPILAMGNRVSWRILLGAEHGDAPSPDEDTWGLRVRGGGSAETGMLGYRTYFGRYTAGIFVRDKDESWSLPPDLNSRLNLRSRLQGR